MNQASRLTSLPKSKSQKIQLNLNKSKEKLAIHSQNESRNVQGLDNLNSMFPRSEVTMVKKCAYGVVKLTFIKKSKELKIRNAELMKKNEVRKAQLKENLNVVSLSSLNTNKVYGYLEKSETAAKH